jgi:hypothetical protein
MSVVDPDADKITTVVLAEFTALRAEIVSRATVQAGLITLNITAVGTAIGFAIGGAAFRPYILLAVPFLSGILGMSWIDHARNNTSLGMYIGRVLWPRLREISGEIPSREDDVRSAESRFINIVLVGGPPGAGFILPSIFSIVLAGWYLENIATIAIWVLDICITAGLVVAFYLWLRVPSLAAASY